MTELTMTPIDWLRKQLDEGTNDVVRDMLKRFAEQLMSAEVDGLCGSAYRRRGEGRTNQRNGYRERRWDTRAGTIDLAIPKLRSGSYFPEWLLEPRRRAERALYAVVAESFVNGVSTRKVERVAQAMGIESISKSQVSEMAQELDGMVDAFLNRPLAGPYAYIWLDATMVKCREDGRVVNVACVVATGVRSDGHREILGLDVVTGETETSWLTFLRGLVARGLSAVVLVISDSHQGLKNAISAALPGAAWQRCRTHFMRNLLTRVPKTAHDWVATTVRSIFAQPDPESVLDQHGIVVEHLRTKFPEASKLLDEAADEVLAFIHFPKRHWRQIWSNNPLERLNKEIKRRTDVLGIFPNRRSIIRLVGAILDEQNDEWATTRCYLKMEAATPKTEPLTIEAKPKSKAA